MRKKLILLAMLMALVNACPESFAAPASAEGDSPERVFARAAAFYKSGDQAKAIAESEALLSRGYRSGNIYYNLGNAYLMKGEPGEAILNYERAKRYIPRDSDLIANDRYAKSLMKRPDPPEKRFWIFSRLDRVFDYLTFGQAVVFAEVVYYFLIFYIILTKVFGKCARYSTAAIGTLAIILALVIIPLVWKADDMEGGGIVTTSITDARYEPADKATVHFPLYEGMKIHILRVKDGWCKIRRPDGQIGWVKEGDVERIKV